MKVLLIVYVLETKSSLHNATKHWWWFDSIENCEKYGSKVADDYAAKGFFTKVECKSTLETY